MFKIQTTGLSLGPNSGLAAYHGFELIVQSSCWTHGGDYISPLATGFVAVHADVKRSEMWPKLSRRKATEALSVVSISLDYI